MPQKRKTRKVNTRAKKQEKKTGIGIESIIMFIIYIALAVFVLLSDMEFCGPVGLVVKNTLLTLFGTIGHYFYIVLIVLALMSITVKSNSKMPKFFLILFFISIVSFVSAYIDNIDYANPELMKVLEVTKENVKTFNGFSKDNFSAGIISTSINYYLFTLINRAGILVFHGFFVVLFFLLSFGVTGIQLVKNIVVGIVMFIPNLLHNRKERKKEDIRINIENERKLKELIQRKEKEKFVSNITTDELLAMGVDLPYSPQGYDNLDDHKTSNNDANVSKDNDRLIHMDKDLNKVEILDSSKFVYDTEKINIDVEKMKSRFFKLNDLENNKYSNDVERKQVLLNQLKEKSINEIKQEQKDLQAEDFFYMKNNNENEENKTESIQTTNNSQINLDINDDTSSQYDKDLEMGGDVIDITSNRENNQKDVDNPFEENEGLIDNVEIESIGESKEEDANDNDEIDDTDEIEDTNEEETEDIEEADEEEIEEVDDEESDEEVDEETDEESDDEELEEEDSEENDDSDDESEEVEAGEDEIPDTNNIQKLSVDNKFNDKLDAATETAEEKEVKEQVKRTRSRKAPRKYKTPPLYLLKKSEKQKNVDKEYLKETAQTLQTALAQFGVGAKVTKVTVGPTVTRYELLPSQGVRVKKFIELQDDIKLAMAATDIRIEAPIPGKSAVGIEVPNKVIKPVLLGDLVSSSDFRNSESKLSACIGRDIAGNNIICDITTLPHLLVAGSTGSGKSVCINSIIMSLIYKSSPEDVRLILVDPKVVELQVYNDIPHLLVPVVTDPKRAAASLNWAVNEMMRRYNLIVKEQVRNIDDYNKIAEEHNQELQAQEEQFENEENVEVADNEPKEKMEKLPKIVIIIDEFSDLMMVASKEVENAIFRIAQLARACGIYLIIATQRPSVNVISGSIKANVPGRIAFAVSSGIDSKTILDQYGAEKLIGKGDMLYSPTGIPKPIRVQGCLVTDEEIKRVVKFIKDPNVTFDEEIDKQITENSNFDNDDAKEKDTNGLDEYFVEAGKLIIQTKIASSGFLQRKLQIGFNRASRILDQLAENGVVTEQDGKKPREILMELNEFLDTFDV